MKFIRGFFAILLFLIVTAVIGSVTIAIVFTAGAFFGPFAAVGTAVMFLCLFGGIMNTIDPAF